MNEAYATIDQDGNKYKQLAVRMTQLGYPMSTTYANNLFIKALEKLIFKVMKLYGHNVNKEYIRELARSSDFHNMLAPIIRKVYNNNQDDCR